MHKLIPAMLLIVVLWAWAAIPVPHVVAQVDTDTPTPTETATATETPTPTSTPTGEPYIYATTVPLEGTPDGQMTRFEYVASAGDVQIANLLTWQLYTTWALFLFLVLVVLVHMRKK